VRLSEPQLASWRENGFLVFPGFFDDVEVEAVSHVTSQVWRQKPITVTVDDLVTGERKHASQVSDSDVAEHTFKLNDLYLEFLEIRAVALSQRVGSIVRELLDDTPVLCNTLSLEKGSQQPDHLDTLYMTPQTPNKLVATWMALEDVRSDAGPLRYWPGSNHIPSYLFSDGGFHTIPDEMERWAEHMAHHTDRLGLDEQVFLARRGDLFVWHAALLHGGSEIKSPSRTRRSLVSHFFAAHDCVHSTLVPVEGGLWMQRPPQPVLSDAVPLSDLERELVNQAHDERAVTQVQAGIPITRPRALVDRMRRLVLARD